MPVANKKSPFILLIGDLLFLIASLWLTLFLRDLKIPSQDWFIRHLEPFSILFLIWITIFLIAGLYEKYTLLLKSKLATLIFNTQLINVIIAALFFFVTPYFAIAPKTVLVIYLIISSALISVWRLYIFPLIDVGKRQKALLIDGGRELKELYEEISNNSRYNIQFTRVIDVDKISGADLSNRIYKELQSEDISVVVVNTNHKKLVGILPYLYKPIFSNVHFLNAEEIYEDIFERVSLSSIEYSNFLYQLPITTKNAYGLAKRVLDTLITVVVGIPSILIYPFVIIAIKIEDGGKIFICQERVGERNAIVILYKFRTMTFAEKEGAWIGESENKITKVGKILRKTRIDELPQLFNVLRGDLSLIGPRPEIIGIQEKIKKEIPHYNLRYWVKPGLSGWAQIKQEYQKGNISPQSVEESRRKLEYDLYYIKNRSLVLDLIIALRTIKIVGCKIFS